jgi:hypothetical protein
MYLFENAYATPIRGNECDGEWALKQKVTQEKRDINSSLGCFGNPKYVQYVVVYTF